MGSSPNQPPDKNEDGRVEGSGDSQKKLKSPSDENGGLAAEQVEEATTRCQPLARDESKQRGAAKQLDPFPVV